MVKTNRSTLHTVYKMQQSATQGSNDRTHRLSGRTAAATSFNPEGIGCQKQTAPRFCQHPIRWAFTSQAFTRRLQSIRRVVRLTVSVVGVKVSFHVVVHRSRLTSRVWYFTGEFVSL